MTLYRELDWEPIPEHLLYKTAEEIKKNLKGNSTNRYYAKFKTYFIENNELLDFLQKFVEFDVRDKQACYQIVQNDLHVHIDQFRNNAYTYILDSGGENADTVWFEQDMKTEIFRKTIPAKQWHCLDTSVPHTVQGVTTTRIAVTIFKRNTR